MTLDSSAGLLYHYYSEPFEVPYSSEVITVLCLIQRSQNRCTVCSKGISTVFIINLHLVDTFIDRKITLTKCQRFFRRCKATPSLFWLLCSCSDCSVAVGPDTIMSIPPPSLMRPPELSFSPTRDLSPSPPPPFRRMDADQRGRSGSRSIMNSQQLERGGRHKRSRSRSVRSRRRSKSVSRQRSASPGARRRRRREGSREDEPVEMRSEEDLRKMVAEKKRNDFLEDDETFRWVRRSSVEPFYI